MVYEGCFSLSCTRSVPWAAEPTFSLPPSFFPFIRTLLSETLFLCIASSWWE